MKKKLSILLVMLFAFLVFPKEVKAEAVFDFSCNPQSSLQPGQTTNCSLKVTDNDSAISKINLKITSTDMTVKQFVANDTMFSSAGENSQGYTQLTAKNSVGFQTGTVGSVSATLNQDATTCGKICIQVVYYVVGSDQSYTYSENPNGECTELTPPPTATTPEPEQPSTGSFASYAILIGGAAIALGIITYASRSTKFYRV